MDTIFLTLKKTLVATVFVVFAFVMVYVPQAPTSHIEAAEAAASGSIVYDPTNTLQNSWTTAQATISAAVGSADWTKNLALDGLAWSFAKQAVSMMVSELINWVNGGFEGKPAFITDLDNFLFEVADGVIGEAISELGRVGSFICSPFRLDVQISVATQYANYDGGSLDALDQQAPTCTLSGVIDNIEGFIAGTDPGRGLSDWLTITATPQTYTPYGAVLSAKATTRARIINAQGETLTELDWGAGFISQSVCESVAGLTGSQDCSIVTPGKIVQEALTFNLDSGRQMLIEADEINELIGALLGQLANKAITGAAGLLGISGGSASSYTGYDGSYLDALLDEQNQQIAQDGSASTILTDALRDERAYRAESQALLDRLATFIADPNNPEGDRNIAAVLNEEIAGEIANSNINITTLTNLILEYPTANSDRQIEIFIEYSNLNILNPARKADNLNEWREQMILIGLNPTSQDIIDAISDATTEADAQEETDQTTTNTEVTN